MLPNPRVNMPLIPPPTTVGELLYRLGDVPAGRVLFTPVPGTATVDDLVTAGKPACELIDGTLVRRPTGFLEATLTPFLAMRLYPVARDANRGIVINTLAPFRIGPCNAWVADLAFVPWSRLPGGRISTDPVPAVTPSLVIDFYRPGNTRHEFARKRTDYRVEGVDLWWVINARRRTAREFTSDGRSRRLTPADTLDGGAVLPGFTLPLADLFAELDRHG